MSSTEGGKEVSSGAEAVAPCQVQAGTPARQCAPRELTNSHRFQSRPGRGIPADWAHRPFICFIPGREAFFYLFTCDSTL
jgi:hypothetical protein